ncbi:hypothetical protein CL651_002890 [bacterium]|nr:hypothetical protein [bacterium]|tara:strand:- start:53184 stop:53363 length:180 start_codon:yes stop_codon:yes gene_type:complete
MLRIDYIGSAFVCLIIFTLFGLAISNVSHADLGFYLKLVGAILLTAMLVGLLTKFLRNN